MKLEVPSLSFVGLNRIGNSETPPVFSLKVRHLDVFWKGKMGRFGCLQWN